MPRAAEKAARVEGGATLRGNLRSRTGLRRPAARSASRGNKRAGAREQPRPDIASECAGFDWYACEEPDFVQRAREAWLGGSEAGDRGDAFYGQLRLWQQPLGDDRWTPTVLIEPSCGQERGGPHAPVRWGSSRAHLRRPKPRGVAGGGGGVRGLGSNVKSGAPSGKRKSGWRARARANQASAARDGTRRLPEEIKAELGLGCGGRDGHGGQPEASQPWALDLNAGPRQAQARTAGRGARGECGARAGLSHLAPAKRRVDMGGSGGSSPPGAGGGRPRLA